MVGRPRGDFALRTSRVETYQTTRSPNRCAAPVYRRMNRISVSNSSSVRNPEKLESASTTETFCATRAARFFSIALAVMSAKSLAPPTRACASQRRRQAAALPPPPPGRSPMRTPQRRSPAAIQGGCHAPAGERLPQVGSNVAGADFDAKVPTSPPRLPRRATCFRPGTFGSNQGILASTPDSRPISRPVIYRKAQAGPRLARRRTY